MSRDQCVLVFGSWARFSKGQLVLPFLSQGGAAQPEGRQQLKWPFLQFTTIKLLLCGFVFGCTAFPETPWLNLCRIKVMP